MFGLDRPNIRWNMNQLEIWPKLPQIRLELITGAFINSNRMTVISIGLMIRSYFTRHRDTSERNLRTVTQTFFPFPRLFDTQSAPIFRLKLCSPPPFPSATDKVSISRVSLVHTHFSACMSVLRPYKGYSRMYSVQVICIDLQITHER